jgi:hypothetical protein
VITDGADSPTSNNVPIMKSLDRVALIGAPTAWLTGWSIMRLSGHSSPGAAWTTAHAIWTVALILFAVTAVAVHRIAVGDDRDARPIGPVSRTAARIGLSLALAGAATLIVQMALDLAIGFTSINHAAMDAGYRDLFATPGVEMVIYQMAPGALFAGMVALVVAAATQGRVVTSAAVLTVAGVLASALGHGAPGAYRIIEGAGDLLVLLAMVRITQPAPHRGIHRMPARRQSAAVERASVVERTPSLATAGAVSGR